MAEESTTVKCGFCMRKDQAMEDPKVLPCNHVHCFSCLSSFYDVNHRIQCPVQSCRKVSGAPVTTLAPFTMVDTIDVSCDVCQNEEVAAIYCLGCSKRFCEKHQKSHEDVLSEHSTIMMSEYRVQAGKLEKKTCEVHKDQPYILGCKVCLAIACVQCTSGLEECKNGLLHTFMPLKDFPKMLVEDARMITKEEKLEKLFKETSKAQSDYDNKTREMLELLHRTRDDQLSSLRLEYDLLEAQLLEERNKGKVKLAEFLEERVLSKWTNLRNHRLTIESKERNCHEVDFVKGYKELNEQLQRALEDGLPKLEIKDITQLEQSGRNRNIELKMSPSHRLAIDYENGVMTMPPVRLPTSMTAVRSVPTPSRPVTVCSYKEDSYVGLEGGQVVRISSSSQSQTIYTLSGVVQSIRVYNDKIYTLCSGYIRVHGMSGTLVTSWEHSCYDKYSNALTIIADEIILPNDQNKQLIVYSPSGTLIRRVDCPQLTASRIAMCQVDKTSVVVSYNETKTSLVNIMTGQSLWTHEGGSSPPGVICYGGKYILVSQANNNKTHVLDTISGEKVSELQDGSRRDMYVLGMDSAEDQLAISSYHDYSVLFYKLEFE